MTIRALRTESFRVAVLYGLAFAMALGALGALALNSAETAMKSQINQHAGSELGIMRGIFDLPLPATFSTPLERVQQYARRHAEHGTNLDFISVQIAKGDPKLAGNLPALPAVAGIRYIPNPSAPGRTVMVVGAPLAPGVFGFAGTDLEYVSIIRTEILTILLEMFCGIAFLVPLGGFLLSRRFMARTDAIARTCQEIMAGNLSTRIHVDDKQDEMDRLARSINAMLDRIAGLMDSLRQVSGDVAHDLRTPLANLRHGLERARAEDASPAQYAATLDRAIAASDELLALFAAVLRITQIEGGARRSGFASVDLSQLLHKVAEVYHAVAEDAGHQLRLESAEPCLVRGDHDLLFQMLSNLVENAIVHTPPGTRIVLNLDAGVGEAVMHVRDDGPGVPVGECAKLFQRFYRREASRNKPGHGLGLSLVLAVAELHDGTITLETPADGTGMDARVTLPLLRQGEEAISATISREPAPVKLVPGRLWR